ncbi:integrase core domain-containing protein [Hirsutella rhossiliensis]|uniref:Integrase core domain-containing protein n=1 Tax=Hirsutella rhossiliensis TaxID=111463 RepID=A0A9P8N891_9HYPO|nr:integrase core domain-containing protein [Hirsutella rhossiliensis]KAH0968790.1 integrase core domain-containing protein [Hirsutella rhossiliensis]
MSKTSAMAPTKRTILTEPQDWDRWVKELRARVDKLIHKLIFQDGSEAMELPERPTFDDFAQGVRQFVNLTSEQQRAYSAALHEYEGRRFSKNPIRDERQEPCQEIWIDWTELTPDFEGYVRVMFITDAYSGMVFPYFLKTYHSKHHLAALRDFVSWMKLRFDYTVKIVRSDGELFTNKIKKWLRKKGISAEKSASNTQAQNGGAERSGGIVIERARKMRIAAGLPHDLWKETDHELDFEFVGRLENTLELFTKKDQPQQHAQLKAYGCRAYAMTSDAQLGKKKRQKLDPRSHIGYLVGYNSTNIFRIWIPQRRKQPQLLPSINDLIQRVEIPEDQKINQEILDEESELESVFDEDSDEEEEEGQTDPTEEEEEYKRARELEEASLITPPLTEEDLEAGFLISFYDFYPGTT